MAVTEDQLWVWENMALTLDGEPSVAITHLVKEVRRQNRELNVQHGEKIDLFDALRQCRNALIVGLGGSKSDADKMAVSALAASDKWFAEDPAAVNPVERT